MIGLVKFLFLFIDLQQRTILIRAEEQLRTTRNINTEREGEEEEEGGGKDDGKAERRSECLTARQRLWIFTHTAFENRFYSSNM